MLLIVLVLLLMRCSGGIDVRRKKTSRAVAMINTYVRHSSTETCVANKLAVPLVVVTQSRHIPIARHVLSHASLKTPVMTVAIIADITLPIQSLMEFLLVDNVLLLRTDLKRGNNQDDNYGVLAGVRAGMAAFPHMCMMVLDLRDQSLGQDGIKFPFSPQLNVTMFSHQDDFQSNFSSFRQMSCSESRPVTYFMPHAQIVSNIHLLPPFLCDPYLVHEIETFQTRQMEASGDLVVPENWIQRPWTEAMEYSTVFRDNPLFCTKRHILRTKMMVEIPRTFSSSSPRTGSKRDGRAVVCIGTPIKGPSRMFVDVMLPSLKSTVLTHGLVSLVHLYVAWEDSDTFLSVEQNRHDLMSEMTQILGPDFLISLQRFPHVEQDIAFLWNQLFIEAYEDGCDYLSHLTSDVDVNKTVAAGPGWMDRFIMLLASQGNTGMIGNSDDVNTMPFVHRTHLEIFAGRFYSSMTHNIMCDTAVWALYKSLGLLAGPDDLEHWINLSDVVQDPTKTNYRFCGIRTYDEEGAKSVPNWPDLSSQYITEYFAAVKHEVRTRYPTTAHPTKRPSIPRTALEIFSCRVGCIIRKFCDDFDCEAKGPEG